MKKTNVYLRKEKKKISVDISSDNDLLIMDSLTAKWQSIINILAKIINVPSGLVMKITDDSMEVFLKSKNKENPYRIGGSDTLGHGLYCETVIGKNEPLIIKNALKDSAWKNNPDVKINMISYYGLPIKWPNGSFFGTICVLDNKENDYNDDFIELMNIFKNSMEEDLKILKYQKKLTYISEIDILTTIYNRRKCISILEKEFNRSSRSKIAFSIALIDINKFKNINDRYGHNIGDEVLKLFAKTLKDNIRSIDSISRWGGDEFLLICPNTDKFGVEVLMNKIKKILPNYLKKQIPFPSFSFGIASYSSSDKSYSSLVARADKRMYSYKNKIK